MKWEIPVAAALMTYSTNFAGGLQAPITTPWKSNIGGFGQINQTAGGHGEGEGSNALAALLATSFAFSTNHSATITLDPTSSLGPAVRVNTINGICYVCYLGTHAQILKYASDTSNIQVGSDVIIPALNPGDLVTLSVTGTSSATLSVYVNGAFQGSVTDSSSPYTSGQPGFFINGFGDITGFSATDI